MPRGYRLIARVGEGGVGRVYRAEYVGKNEPPYEEVIAIKTFSPRRKEEIAHLKKIAKVVMDFQHPHLTRVYELCQEDSYYYLLMEFVEGGELSRVIKKRGPLPVKEVVDLALKIARGLDYIHHHGLVHADFKLENVRVNEKMNTVKITDLDHSMLLQEPKGKISTLFRKIFPYPQEKIRMVGTPQYLSPEQIRGEKASPLSDIYAFGVSLYVLLTGKPPFCPSSSQKEFYLSLARGGKKEVARKLAQEELLRQHLEEEVIPPSHLNKWVPSPLDRIVLKCMEKEPARRYHEMRDLLEDLYEVGYEFNRSEIHRFF